jgi:hypothetical protein
MTHAMRTDDDDVEGAAGEWSCPDLADSIDRLNRLGALVSNSTGELT